jgi:hypothetical protein
VPTLSATKLLVTFNSEIVRLGEVNLSALNVSAYRRPVLRVLVTTVLMFMYPPKGA